MSKIPHAHEGEEVHLVIKGKIHTEQGEDSAEFREIKRTSFLVKVF